VENILMKNVSVVLTDVRNPLNIGAAARAMANFGFSDLRLANAYRVASEEARSGPNADSVLAAARDYATLADAVADAALVIGTTSATKRDVRLPIISLTDIAEAFAAASPVALVFGSEKFGLSNEDMSHCHWLLRIPTEPEVPSMNLGQAVAVVLYELIRVPGTEALPSPERIAPAGMCEELTQRLHEALDLSGYVHTESTLEKLRKLILRMRLREDDAVMWLGMVRQILWRLKSSR
jgi:tRNA/rRNA methyltransferase